VLDSAARTKSLRLDVHWSDLSARTRQFPDIDAAKINIMMTNGMTTTTIATTAKTVPTAIPAAATPPPLLFCFRD
jgi:hypothetical protein